jgi:hypothetical protein
MLNPEARDLREVVVVFVIATNNNEGVCTELSILYSSGDVIYFLIYFPLFPPAAKNRYLGSLQLLGWMDVGDGGLAA